MDLASESRRGDLGELGVLGENLLTRNRVRVRAFGNYVLNPCQFTAPTLGWNLSNR